jgi:hypothetical protein
LFTPGIEFLVLHRSRDLLMRQRTMILNAIRAHMAEFGTVAAQGPRNVVDLVICDCEALWTPSSIIDDSIRPSREVRAAFEAVRELGSAAC